jgi:Asp-tRNA(Asn)/Glu-tRNA(Gln) amidotransferase A subunit family amidase
MHGLPQVVKDLAATKGIRTTLGSPLFQNYMPFADAIFIERLRANDAIIIGKTNTPELGERNRCVGGGRLVPDGHPRDFAWHHV